MGAYIKLYVPIFSYVIMALENTAKKQVEDIPIYTIYGKKYKFSDLQEATERGFGDYLATLKRGAKDETLFRNAYRDLMEGIKSGDVVFKDGRFIDSAGLRSNSKDKNKDKDYYGHMANFIYQNMGRSDEYGKELEASKIKWTGSDSVGKALIKELYNSDRENLPDFIEVDGWDPNSNSRPTKERAAHLAKAFLAIAKDFDNRFSDVPELDRLNQLAYIESAIKSLGDGSIDAGDYLALSRAANGLDYRRMFTNLEDYLLKEEQTPATTTAGDTTENPKVSLWNDFVAYGQRYATPAEKLIEYDLSDNTNMKGSAFGDYTWNSIVNSFKQLPKEELYSLLMDSLYWDTSKDINGHDTLRKMFGNGSYNFTPWNVTNAAVAALESDFQPLGDNIGQFLIPNSENNSKNTALVYDRNAKKIKEVGFHNIPQMLERIWNEYLMAKNNMEMPDWANEYLKFMTVSRKNGGVLKAQHGIRLSDNANWYTGVYRPQLDTVLNNLLNDKDYWKWLNDMQRKHHGIYTAAGGNTNSWEETAYKSDAVGAYQDLYKSGKGGEFEEGSGGYNQYGIANSQNLGMFDLFGNYKRQTGDWMSGSPADSWKTDGLYSSVTDYRRLLGREGDYTPEQLQEAQAKFKDAGYKLYLDEGTGYYMLDHDLGSTSISTDLPTVPGDATILPAPGSPTGLGAGDTGGGALGQTEVDPITGQGGKGKKAAKIAGAVLAGLSEAAPAMIGASRLALSLRTNNKVADIIKKSLQPVLKDTYELYSPITGAFSEMLARNRQAADVRRQGSRPITSDASLLAATQLDANRQATDLEYQGFLADDKEILRTQQEALKRQEDNKARRSEVANFNRASINQNNRERAQLEATRRKSNWSSWDNFLAGIEGKLEQKQANASALRESAAQSAMALDYENAIRDLNQKYKEAHPNATTTEMLNDPAYLGAVSSLRHQLSYESYNIGQGRYSDPFAGYTPTSYSDIISKVKFKKNGGTLRPSTLLLINKVIKNESNT